MGYIGDRVIDLPFFEWPSAPVGEAGTLVEHMAKHRLDEIRITDLLAIAECHCRYLRIEQRRRRLAGQIVDDFEVLPAGVKDFQDLVILDQQVEQRLQVQSFGLWVDGGGLVR